MEHRRVVGCAWLVAIAWATLVVPARAQVASRPPNDRDIAELQARVKARIEAVGQQAQAIVECPPDQTTPCKMRLWVGKPFLSDVLEGALAGKAVTLKQDTVRRPPLITGGDAAGCGWDAGVDSMFAALSLGSLNQVWSADGAPLKLTLNPAFALSMQAQVRGHVNAPPGMCHWYNPFDWSCSCPIGGGFGTSVGVSASASGRFPLAAAFGASGRQLTIVADHPTATNINVRLRVGLGIFGSVGFNVPVGIPKLPLYSGSVPLALGTRGQVTIVTTVTPYDLTFSADPPVAERNGIAIRGLVAIKPLN